AVARPLVDLDARVPDRRRARYHPRRDGLGPLREALLVLQPDQPLELRDVALGGLGLGERGAEALDLLLQVLVLLLRVEGVARPAEQVADRLERAAGACLDRNERLLGAAL